MMDETTKALLELYEEKVKNFKNHPDFLIEYQVHLDTIMNNINKIKELDYLLQECKKYLGEVVEISKNQENIE